MTANRVSHYLNRYIRILSSRDGRPSKGTGSRCAPGHQLVPVRRFLPRCCFQDFWRKIFTDVASLEHRNPEHRDGYRADLQRFVSIRRTKISHHRTKSQDAPHPPVKISTLCCRLGDHQILEGARSGRTVIRRMIAL